MSLPPSFSLPWKPEDLAILAKAGHQMNPAQVEYFKQLIKALGAMYSDISNAVNLIIKEIAALDHGASLAGLGDDDHAHYFNETRGDARYQKIAQGAWIEPTLLNSWVNYDASWSPAGYYKDTAGTVHVKGVIKDGTYTQAAFLLPAGYRPAVNDIYPCASWNGVTSVAGFALVYADGNVVPWHGVTGAGTWFSFGRISFEAA